jgi:hypothetical protein
MFCAERCRCFEQSPFTAVRFVFPRAFEKPIGEKLKLDMLNAVIVQD